MNRLSLANLEHYFENGSPVNMPEWEEVKNLPDQVNREGRVEISYKMIENTFNNIRNSATMMIVSSKHQQFIQFCFEHEILVIPNPEYQVYILESLH